MGVWQENEAEEAAKYNQVPGDPKLLDVDQNYKYNNDDKVFLGNTTPKVRWNMRNEFTYSRTGISLSVCILIWDMSKQWIVHQQQCTTECN